jgi:hypothetical protein
MRPTRKRVLQVLAAMLLVALPRVVSASEGGADAGDDDGGDAAIDNAPTVVDCDGGLCATNFAGAGSCAMALGRPTSAESVLPLAAALVAVASIRRRRRSHA